MDTFFSIIGKVLNGVWEFTLFIVVSLLFIPSFLVVNTLQGYWSKKLGELFGL